MYIIFLAIGDKKNISLITLTERQLNLVFHNYKYSFHSLTILSSSPESVAIESASALHHNTSRQ